MDSNHRKIMLECVDKVGSNVFKVLFVTFFVIFGSIIIL